MVVYERREKSYISIIRDCENKRGLSLFYVGLQIPNSIVSLSVTLS